MPKKPNNRKERQKNDLEEIDRLKKETEEPNLDLESNKFSALPISSKTLEGLKSSNFMEMTEIQKLALPLALSKKDVLAAAKTGSGKTLAFLIPVIENLYLNKWGPQDGLGALIISPTRELAIQIFRILCKIGKNHAFSAGLVIGGKEVKIEKERINKMNILIGTPGRILQHMDETAGFNADGLQVLVLDEADRILDMGFSKSVNSIIEFLPKDRQTLLFSATQTKSIKDLSRLSLKDPEYVGVYETAKFSTPKNLSQFYMQVGLEKKLDYLYSFIKTHLKSKGIVFVSSCKQVRYVYETFRKLQPGIPLLHLHGKQKQSKRIEIYEKYSKMPECFLFCTDIAARGLDFPSIEWVIQLDCPEDIETYIHRIGRTARYESTGNSLMFLLESEIAILDEFKKYNIDITKIQPKKSQLISIQNLLQSYCFKDSEIKYLAQKAFVSYMRSIYLQKNKAIFDVSKLPAEEFATSLGLVGTPQIKFQKKKDKTINTNDDKVQKVKLDEPEEKENVEVNKTKMDKLFNKKNQTVLAEHYKKLVDREDNDTDSEDEEEEFITIKRKDHELELDAQNNIFNIEEVANMTKKQILNAKQKALKNAPKNERMLFDEDGKAHQLYELEDGNEFLNKNDVKAIQKEYFDTQNIKLKEQDVLDKSIAKEKKKEKKKKQKNRDREDFDEDQTGAVLDTHESDDYESNEEESDDDRVIVDYSRKRTNKAEDKDSKKTKVIHADQPLSIEDQEALALKLLNEN